MGTNANSTKLSLPNSAGLGWQKEIDRLYIPYYVVSYLLKLRKNAEDQSSVAAINTALETASTTRLTWNVNGYVGKCYLKCYCKAVEIADSSKLCLQLFLNFSQIVTPGNELLTYVYIQGYTSLCIIV